MDAAYSEALDNLRIRKPIQEFKAKSLSAEEQERKDYYANVRTNVLLCWVLSNALLAALILGGGTAAETFTNTSSRTTIYMLCILCFVAATSLFRLMGAIIYLVVRLVKTARSAFV